MGPELQEQASINVSRLWAIHSIYRVPHRAINARRVGDCPFSPFGHSEFSADRAMIIVQLQQCRGVMRRAEWTTTRHTGKGAGSGVDHGVGAMATSAGLRLMEIRAWCA